MKISLCVKPTTEIIGVSEVRLIDLNPNNPNNPNTIGNYSIQSTQLNFLANAKYYLADFNGDGKTDLMAIKIVGLILFLLLKKIKHYKL